MTWLLHHDNTSTLVYKTLIGKSEEKRPLGRPTDRWEDNFTMNPEEMGLEGAEWNHMA
jgi:hypothetical protein